MIIKPPQSLAISNPNKKRLFLAGTIDNGDSEDWQERVGTALASEFNIINPRRDEWDATWKQDSAEMYQQIHWELSGLETADNVLFNFLPNSKSPVTMLELGLIIGWKISYHKEVLVICPPEFYRYANIEAVCSRYGITLFHTEEDFVRTVLDD